jgi:hypothetical protein
MYTHHRTCVGLCSPRPVWPRMRQWRTREPSLHVTVSQPQPHPPAGPTSHHTLHLHVVLAVIKEVQNELTCHSCLVLSCVLQQAQGRAKRCKHPAHSVSCSNLHAHQYPAVLSTHRQPSAHATAPLRRPLIHPQEQQSSMLRYHNAMEPLQRWRNVPIRCCSPDGEKHADSRGTKTRLLASTGTPPDEIHVPCCAGTSWPPAGM